MTDQLVTRAASYRTHNEHKRMPSSGFKTAIPAIERPQTYELDGTATGICRETI
jgi:hypothetical protein